MPDERFNGISLLRGRRTEGMTIANLPEHGDQVRAFDLGRYRPTRLITERETMI
jgi:hypothetical protein